MEGKDVSMPYQSFKKFMIQEFDENTYKTYLQNIKEEIMSSHKSILELAKDVSGYRDSFKSMISSAFLWRHDTVPKSRTSWNHINRVWEEYYERYRDEIDLSFFNNPVDEQKWTNLKARFDNSVKFKEELL